MKELGLTMLSIFLAVLLYPAPTVAEDVDPAGTWQATRSNSNTEGPCPMGGDGGGELTINKTDGGLTLIYGKGFKCSPTKVCRLEGSEAEGTHTFTTTVPVDNEGGTVTNDAEIKFTSASSATGKGSSKYSHPSGFTCTWTFDLSLSR